MSSMQTEAIADIDAKEAERRAADALKIEKQRQREAAKIQKPRQKEEIKLQKLCKKEEAKKVKTPTTQPLVWKVCIVHTAFFHSH